MTGERVSVREPVDEAALREQLQAALDAGVRSLAVVLVHSYLYVPVRLGCRLGLLTAAADCCP